MIADIAIPPGGPDGSRPGDLGEVLCLAVSAADPSHAPPMAPAGAARRTVLVPSVLDQDAARLARAWGTTPSMALERALWAFLAPVPAGAAGNGKADAEEPGPAAPAPRPRAGRGRHRPPAVALPGLPPPPRHLPRSRDRAALLSGYIRCCESGLDRGLITFAEGGTGLGKTGAIVALALRALRRGAGPVVIAVPTIAGISHALDEWRRGNPRRGEGAPAVLLGRAQYVNPDLLAIACSPEDPVFDLSGVPRQSIEAARRWLEQGGPPASAPTMRIAATGGHFRWLVDDLRHVAPGFPAEDCVSPSLENDAYSAAREAADSAGLVLCTHAMLAANERCRLRGGASPLPDWATLLVDEAHDLEDAFARTMGGSVSLRTLGAALIHGLHDGTWTARRLGAAAERAAAAVADAEERLRALCPNGRLTARPGRGLEPVDPESEAALRRVAGELADALEPFGRSDSGRGRGAAAAARVAEWRSSLDAATDPGQTVTVSFSAVVRAPTFFVGPSSLGAIFRRLWEATPAAALFSGTLYLRSGAGLDPGWIAHKLWVPQERVHQFPPVHPGWAHDAEIRVPDPEGCAQLSFPRERGEEGPRQKGPTMEQWRDAVAARLRPILRQAPGGTLVLCNSYGDIEALAAALGPSPRVIAQRRGDAVAILKDRHLAAAAAGRRPVWLATGPAWQGLDLVDQAQPDRAADPSLLDLVVVRFPFQPPTTPTALARQERGGFNSVSKDAQIRFRQGIGRLVRGDAEAPKRLWILDGRICRSDWPRFFAALLAPYAKRGPLPPPEPAGPW